MKHKKQITKIVKQAKRPENKSQKKTRKEKSVSLNYPQGEYIEGVGRRKVATARVRIYKEDADFVVNDILAKDYFADVPMAAKRLAEPFELTKTKDQFAVTVKVSGSGKTAQLEAVIHGLSRALEKYQPELRPFLKEAGLLTRDSRMKETRKPGRGGKARRKRQSPKR